jgi:hypothetical protein
MAYDKDIEIKRLRRLVDWLQSDRVLELRATLDAAIRDTFCTLLKEHGSEEFRPSALPSLDDSSSLLAQPKVAPSPGTEDAQARPSSPAPSARGAGARWLQQQLGTWLCSKCGAWRDMLGAPEHERTCWTSPAVSARQDAGSKGHWTLDIGEPPPKGWPAPSPEGNWWDKGFKEGWSAARARALKMSSEPRGAQEGKRG